MPDNPSGASPSSSPKRNFKWRDFHLLICSYREG
jgi:hypothetical protein